MTKMKIPLSHPLTYTHKNYIMSKFLTITAILLLGVWTVGLFIYDLGFAIHLFLLLAATALIIKVIREK